MSPAPEGRNDEVIVVLGPSVAGAEVLPALVRSIPPTIGAPIVIALPLDNARLANLAVVLARTTPLIVEPVSETLTLEPGSVLLVSSLHSIRLSDRRITVAASDDRDDAGSIVDFLQAAAKTYGDRLTMVLLGGTPADGIAGAIEVKNAGGTLIVQAEPGLRFPSLFNNLPPTLIDGQVDVEQIGPFLHDLVRDASTPVAPATAEEGFQQVLDVVNRSATIDFRLYKPTTIVRRIGRRMAVTQCTTMESYAHYLLLHEDEVGALVQSFLINVTQFFRDPEAFAVMREVVLPPLIAAARAHDHVLRLWSAGCATGEEAYSLAMLISDMLGDELSEWTIKVFATDVDDAAITFARQGLYPQPLLAGVPVEYRERFFEKVDDGYRVSKTLRHLVIFGQQDLSQSPPFPRIDLVLCRNVLIYFTAELQDFVLSQFAFSLSTQRGYLFLGKAETVRPQHEYFEITDKRWKIYRCSHLVPQLPRRLARHGVQPSRLLAAPFPTSSRYSKPARDTELAGGGLEADRIHTLNDVLLRFLPTGAVVIDRAYRLITTNLAARRLLGLRDGSADQDFLHAVHGIPYREARTAIDTVFRERQAVHLTDISLSSDKGGSGPFLTLAIVPMQIEGSATDLVLINVIDVTDQVEGRRELEGAQARQAQLIGELDLANRRLSELNQAFQDANEELQVTNEEMVLTHEELQASIEEFEATNEELQATNEELETNNEELQATNEELQTTNDELRARTNELQDLSLALEGERTRFADMVELAPFSILALRGPSLVVQAMNASYARHLQGRQVYGRPLAELAGFFGLGDGALIDVAFDVYRTGVQRRLPPQPMSVSEPGDGSSERWQMYGLVPTHNAIGSVDGLIIYAEDVTEQHTHEAEEERQRLDLIFDNAQRIALALYDATTHKLTAATARYLDLMAQVHSVARDTVVGRPWEELSLVPAGDPIPHWPAVTNPAQRIALPLLRVTLDGSENETIWDSSIVVVPPAADGRIQYVLVSALDVTEQVKARDELERLDRLKDEFLSLASHELRTPLTPLMGYADMVTQILKQQPINDEHERQRIDRFTSQFTRQIDRLNRLVGDLVDVGRLQNGKWALRHEPLEVGEIVAQAVSEARAVFPDQSITVTQNDPAGPIPVEGDAIRLHQVMSNLLTNALTYAASSPTVDVRLRRIVTGSAEADWAEIEVEDYGPGIPPAALPSLFERFFQVERADRPARGGLGLGLYIVRQIIEQHGGTIEVVSEEGKGTRFRIRLPLAR